MIKEPFGEIRDVCPNCSGDFVEAIQCDICHEYITGDYIITKNEEVVCDECFTKFNITDI